MDSYAQKIRDLREGKDITQDEAAKALGVTRPTYNAIETGKRAPTLDEIHKLCILFDTTLQKFLFSSTQAGLYENHMSKYKQLILNCLQYGSSEGDSKISKIKLALLVYMCDFAAYYEEGASISTLSYRHTSHGPIVDAYYRMIDELYDEGAITIELRGRAVLLYANEPAAPHTLLSDKEVNLIKDVCEPWRDESTQTVIDFIKGNTPSKLSTLGEIIPYASILNEPANPFFKAHKTS